MPQQTLVVDQGRNHTMCAENARKSGIETAVFLTSRENLSQSMEGALLQFNDRENRVILPRVQEKNSVAAERFIGNFPSDGGTQPGIILCDRMTSGSLHTESLNYRFSVKFP